jgi:hypothetical protein
MPASLYTAVKSCTSDETSERATRLGGVTSAASADSWRPRARPIGMDAGTGGAGVGATRGRGGGGVGTRTSGSGVSSVLGSTTISRTPLFTSSLSLLIRASS